MYWILIVRTHIILFFYYITIKFGLSFRNARSVSAFPAQHYYSHALSQRGAKPSFSSRPTYCSSPRPLLARLFSPSHHSQKLPRIYQRIGSGNTSFLAYRQRPLSPGTATRYLDKPCFNQHFQAQPGLVRTLQCDGVVPAHPRSSLPCPGGARKCLALCPPTYFHRPSFPLYSAYNA